MSPSNTFATQSDMRQRINISGLRDLFNQQQASMPQPAARRGFMSMPQSPVQSSFGPYGGFSSPVVFQQQPFFSSPGVAATNGYPAGSVPNQQQFYNPQGRSQLAYAPGVAATSCFPTGNVPYQPQPFSQAQAYGGQYSQPAINTPAQSPFLAQNVVSTFAPPHQQVQQQQQQQQQPEREILEYVDLTGDDEEEVQTLAPVTFDVVVVPAAQQTGLPTPDATPSPPKEPSTPSAPSHLRERVNHLKLTIKEGFDPCAFRLFRSFEFMNPKQKREYCSLFWPSNEEAHADILRASKLSLDFSDIFYRRKWLHSKLQEPMTEEEREKLDEENEAACAEMERTCKAKLQDRRGEEDLSNLHQVVTTTKGKKTKAYKAAQLEVWDEENERTQEAKRKRWEKLNGKPISTSLAGKKRKERAVEEPAPAPKKRGRPPKVRAVEKVAVVKEKKKRGRPRKNPVVQELTPDHTINEAMDDGAFEAELRAGLSGDVVEEEDDGSFETAMLAGFAADDNNIVDESAAVEPSGQLQRHEEEGSVAAAIVEDFPAACSEELPVNENVAEVVSSSQEQGQEEEGCNEDSLFEDFTWDSLLNSETANEIGATLDSMF